ncbi:uncharacterized protein LOC142568048 [Dermacentor variabilis]
MGIGVPGGIEIHRLLRDCLSTMWEETPSRKTPSSISLDALGDGAKDDVSYAFSNLAIQDVLPDNRNLVVKPWSKVDERTCGSHTGHPSRLFPRAEWYPPNDMGVKDIVAQCNTMQVPWTAHGAWQKTVVPSTFTVLQLMQSARDPSMPGAEAPATMSGPFIECDHVPSVEYSLDVFGCRLRIHPRDTLPCTSTMLNAFKTESIGDTHDVARPSSCLWRLHARFAQPRADGSSAAHASNGSNDDRGFTRRRLQPPHFHLLGSTLSRLSLQNNSRISRRP